MRIENADERNFYEIEAYNEGWDKSQKRFTFDEDNYYDREVKMEYENPVIGILLCKEKRGAMVKLTLPPDANIYASEYKLYLQDKKLLQEKLKQWLEEENADE